MTRPRIPCPRGRAPIWWRCSRRQAGGGEALQGAAVGSQHAERRVPAADQLDGDVGDLLQHAIDRHLGRERQVRLKQSLEPDLRGRFLLGGHAGKLKRPAGSSSPPLHRRSPDGCHTGRACCYRCHIVAAVVSRRRGRKCPAGRPARWPDATGARLTLFPLAEHVAPGRGMAGIEIPRFAERVQADLVVLPRMLFAGELLADAVTRRSRVPSLVVVASGLEDLRSLAGGARRVVPMHGMILSMVTPLVEALGRLGGYRCQVREYGDVFAGVAASKQVLRPEPACPGDRVAPGWPPAADSRGKPGAPPGERRGLHGARPCRSDTCRQRRRRHRVATLVAMSASLLLRHCRTCWPPSAALLLAGALRVRPGIIGVVLVALATRGRRRRVPRRNSPHSGLINGALLVPAG